MAGEYDMHLAAERISRDSIAKLTEIGFTRDEFANLTHCHTGEYHATYRGAIPLPDEGVWARTTAVLNGDARFSGYLELEATPLELLRTYPVPVLGSLPPLPPAVGMVECTADLRKAADVHIGVMLEQSTPDALSWFDALHTAYVEKPTPAGTRRVYTVTFEAADDAKLFASTIDGHLKRLPGWVGKMKLEVIKRQLRKPFDAVTLPIARTFAVADWVAAMSDVPLLLRTA
jgi:hypothetical protein